jgi:predicted dehydrogenase
VSDPVRWGILSTANINEKVLAGVSGSPAVSVVAVGSRSPDGAREFAGRHGIPRAHGSYEALLADEEVEAVYIPLPNGLHVEWTLAALAAGKHVLSEKPLGVNSRETTALVRQAAAARGVSGVCFNYRHFPLVAQARAVIAAQEIGPVHLVHGGYLQDWLLFAGDWNWRLESGQAGPARAVGDIGSHWLDLVQYITGDKVAAVMADMSILHASRWRPVGSGHTFEGAGAPGGPAGAGEGDSVAVDTEDAASVLLRFASGAKGTMTVSQVSAGRKNRLFFEINAARASLAWDQEEPNQLWIGRRDRENAGLPRDPSLLRPEAAALARYPGGHQEGWPDALRNLLEDFYRAAAARDRDEPYQGSFATFSSAHQIALIVEAVLRSHRSGAWAAVEDGPGEEDST